MSDAFDAGRKAGFEADGEIDAFGISSFVDEYRVGYVIGFTQSEHAGTPAPHWSVFAGENAAKARVPMQKFREHFDRESWSSFTEGYENELNADQDD